MTTTSTEYQTTSGRSRGWLCYLYRKATTTLDAIEGLMLRCAKEITARYSQEGRVPTTQGRARYYA